MVHITCNSILSIFIFSYVLVGLKDVKEYFWWLSQVVNLIHLERGALSERTALLDWFMDISVENFLDC